jgi:hypothetical protein
VDYRPANFDLPGVEGSRTALPLFEDKINNFRGMLLRLGDIYSK